MLYYVPLESYRERYTMQLSSPVNGWFESNWIKAGVDYRRITPEVQYKHVQIPIRIGQVIDAISRPHWTFAQIERLIELADHGMLTDKDVIYFDDFWTPGIEALAYALELMNVKPKMYAYLWAQSVDCYDFTAPMIKWMRPFEKGIGRILSGVFVANTMLHSLVVDAEICPPYATHVVGLPFDSREVLSRMPSGYAALLELTDSPFSSGWERKNQVVFASRWDKEKDPTKFVDVFHKVRKNIQNVKFVVTTSSPKLRSNSIELLALAKKTAEEFPDNFVILENQTKEQYYQTLCESKVSFNSAFQDWVSYTLLEASVAGCIPIYPNFRSFPETLAKRSEYLYDRTNDAVEMVTAALLAPGITWSPLRINERKWIHERMDDTWLRILREMKVDTPLVGRVSPKGPYSSPSTSYVRVT
jgi:glycosyltransferase involved in cell wall biosynthesis